MAFPRFPPLAAAVAAFAVLLSGCAGLDAPAPPADPPAAEPPLPEAPLHSNTTFEVTSASTSVLTFALGAPAHAFRVPANATRLTATLDWTCGTVACDLDLILEARDGTQSSATGPSPLVVEVPSPLAGGWKAFVQPHAPGATVQAEAHLALDAPVAA